MTTTTLTLTQQGIQASQTQTIDNPANSCTVDATLFSALYRYQLGTGAMIGYPLQFVSTVSGAANGDVFVLITISDPDLVSAIVNNAVLPLDQIPSAFTHFVTGTAPYVELARVTVTTVGTYTFDLDLEQLTPIMASALNPTGGWNGSLLLWLYTPNSTGALWTPPTLTAGVYLSHTNRDTGRVGAPPGSRVDRCPVTGLVVSRQRMVKDGYRDIYVHPKAYDPPEPDPMEWSDYPDVNED